MNVVDSSNQRLFGYILLRQHCISKCIGRRSLRFLSFLKCSIVGTSKLIFKIIRTNFCCILSCIHVFCMWNQKGEYLKINENGNYTPKGFF